MTVHEIARPNTGKTTCQFPAGSRDNESVLPGTVVPTHMFGPNRPQRITGAANISFKNREGKTVLSDLGQSGSAKIKIPKTYDGVPLAVLLNTAGGITGGDDLTFGVHIGKACKATVSTQAAERVYRAQHGAGTVTNNLSIEADGTCAWLPQETILFEKSALKRRFNVDLADRANLIAIESVVLGRKAMGETIASLHFQDSWRIHQNGKLIFADETRLSGDIASALKGYATGNGAGAFATLIAVGPSVAEKLDPSRTLIEELNCDAGVSLVNGVLVARLVASDGDRLRDNLIKFLTDFRGADMPRVWYC